MKDEAKSRRRRVSDVSLCRLFLPGSGCGSPAADAVPDANIVVLGFWLLMHETSNDGAEGEGETHPFTLGRRIHPLVRPHESDGVNEQQQQQQLISQQVRRLE